MAWEVEYTEQFEEWWNDLEAETQNAIDVSVGLLEDKGPELPFPFSSGIKGSRHGHMRELRVQAQGEVLEFSTPSTPGGRRSS